VRFTPGKVLSRTHALFARLSTRAELRMARTHTPRQVMPSTAQSQRRGATWQCWQQPSTSAAQAG
jgi:hypothetical protein